MKTSVILKMNLFAAAINLGLNLILLSIFKNVLTALTTLISYFIVFICIRKEVMKHWSIKFSPEIILKAIISSMVMGVILFVLSLCGRAVADRIWYILAQIIIAMMVYIANLFFIKAFSKKELQFIKNIFS
jgi:O-antigen/teichoic acid export membrane protein